MFVDKSKSVESIWGPQGISASQFCHWKTLLGFLNISFVDAHGI